MTPYPYPLQRPQWVNKIKYVLMVGPDGRIFESLGPWTRYNSLQYVQVFLG